MKKIVIMVSLLLSLFAYKVSAAPNTGRLPENGVKVNFNSNGTVNSMEGDEWAIESQSDSLTLTKGDVIVTLFDYVFKDGNEIIGFSWSITGATADLWVKHGTSSLEYGNGTSGSFTTSDRKGVSNAVFLVEISEDEDEIVDDEDDNDDEIIDEEESDEENEEEVIDEEDKEELEEDVDDQDEEDEEVLGDDDENEEEAVEEEVGEDDENEEAVEEETEEEDQVLSDEEESLPDTSDVSGGLGLLSGMLGLGLLVASRKRKTA